MVVLGKSDDILQPPSGFWPRASEGSYTSHSDATRASGCQEEKNGLGGLPLQEVDALPPPSPLGRNQEFRMRWKFCR